MGIKFHKKNKKNNNLKLSYVIAIFAMASSLPVLADFTGKVVRIADGDTVTVLDMFKKQHKIRLTGIDAPERRQPFGNRSKQSLSNMVFSKTVTVKTNRRDRYGRKLGKILINGMDVNREQIRRGMAWHAYQRDQSASDRKSYADAEIKAKDQKRGLWVNPDPLPPWDWRKLRRQRQRPECA